MHVGVTGVGANALELRSGQGIGRRAAVQSAGDADLRDVRVDSGKNFGLFGRPESGAFVVVSTVQDGHVYEFAAAQESRTGLLDVVAIDDRAERGGRSHGTVEDRRQRIDWHFSETSQSVGGRTAVGGCSDVVVVDVPGRSIRIARRAVGRSTRLHDGTAEKAIITATVGKQLIAHTPAAGAFAPNRDLVRITTKSSDVLLHPVQGQPLVLESEVRGPLLLHCTSPQEAKPVETVVDAHTDERLARLGCFVEDIREVVARVTVAAFKETTAVDPKPHGELGVLGDAAGTNHVDRQAVLGDHVAQHPLVAAVAVAFRRVLGRVLGVCPRRVERLRVAEAQVPDGRLCVWHAEEEVLVVGILVDAVVGPVLDGDGGRVAGGD
ncbi:hypothetical protein ON010_g17560 [Phytophthora cinnamomi]|nr:hypothetical protein ON010_g17560 [Phytophthora cinnamomi]